MTRGDAAGEESLQELAGGAIHGFGGAKVWRRAKNLSDERLGILNRFLGVEAGVMSAEVWVCRLAREAAAASGDIPVGAAVRGSV